MSKTLDEVGIDSIDLVEVVMAIEQNLKIRLEDEDTEKIHECRTVGEIIEAITTSVYLATHTTTRLPRTFTNN
ncbi:MAG: phosphopantetheine-binding protein [Patescibacteria group bacterium]